MLKILNEKPPSTDIFDDKSYNFSNSFRDMVKTCLQKNAHDRPTAKELLKHRFFSKHAQNHEYVKSFLLKKNPLLLDQVDRSKIFSRKAKVERFANEEKPVTHDQHYKPVTLADSWLYDFIPVFLKTSFPTPEERAELHIESPVEVDMYGTIGLNLQAETPTVQTHGRFRVASHSDDAETQICPRESAVVTRIFEVADSVDNKSEPPEPKRKFVVEDV